MLTDFARFFENIDILFAELRARILCIVLVDELRKAQRTSHSSRPAANDDDVGVHLGAGNVLERFTEDEHLKISVWHLPRKTSFATTAPWVTQIYQVAQSLPSC